MYRKVSKIGGYNAASPTVGELKTTYAPLVTGDAIAVDRYAWWYHHAYLSTAIASPVTKGAYVVFNSPTVGDAALYPPILETFLYIILKIFTSSV